MVRPEYSRPALRAVHFDWAGYLGRSDQNVPFHLTKLLFPVPLILLYPTYNKNNQTRGGLGRVCANGMYSSIGHVEFPKFQTGIFVEWKAPIVSLNTTFLLNTLTLNEVHFSRVILYFSKGSLYLSGKLPTYPSPKPTFFPK